MTLNRRETLELVGTAATVGTVGISGCIGTDESDTIGDLPEYSRWLTTDDGFLRFDYLDWATLDEFEGENASDGRLDEEDIESDPIIGLPTNSFGMIFLLLEFGLAPYGLAGVIDTGRGPSLESSADELLLTNEVLIVTGTIRTEEIENLIFDATSEPVEQSDEIGGYIIYEDEYASFAVRSDRFLLTFDEENADQRGANLEALIDGTEENGDLAVDELEELEWLLENAGDGHMAFGRYAVSEGDADELVAADEEFIDETVFEEFRTATGIVSSLMVEDAETTTGTFASIVDEPNETALRDMLGGSATDRSVDIDSDRITATATWRIDE